ncbi:class I SAM-dependent DNA methyltransferase [Corynebacterium epidermidicanis]|uniref:site-specific DNA-methyltransferase (adenine-specific) n=1 Tax=Corynebacterium epidermidicanis TaxID=1050174 RepID=A0A0G3GRJ2_9CORY|nr:DNA methyltransferase [Corynebacterium epidermidicanis]AKK03739.1 Methyltransferase domain [Corynebacterium epidermidicanis]
MTALSPAERLIAAKTFAKTWKGRGNEKSDTQQFWLELLRDVIGMEDTTINVIFEAKTSERGYIDVWIPDAKAFIEQKSIDVSLDKADIRQGKTVTAFQQALNYANTMQFSQRPRYIITCNFDEFRVHDLDKENAEINYLSFTLEELPNQLHLLDFLVDPQKNRAVREEKVSMVAGKLVGKLYDALRSQYLEPDTDESQHSLNVLCVRLVFCLFAEDAGLFNKNAFYDYLNGLRHDQVRTALIELFQVLNTPVEQRDPYLSDQLKAFPYVNGGLFAKDEQIPHFTAEILDLLLHDVSEKTNWSEISPTIFGGVFESTLNPETRAKGGMHYTSPENIHKVIDPLFLDALKDELTQILEEPGVSANKRKKNLEAFHNKIAGLTFFDPACGSGNFLTETYIHLRKLENKILSELAGDQTQLGFSDVTLKVSLNQFHGIEINDFAVSVASTALWIAQLQANLEAEEIVTTNIESLPLHDAANIHHGNALRIDWNEVIAPEKCNYIIGNPPFLGYSRLTDEQKEDRKAIFGKDGGLLDYVACWHKKAADFMEGTQCEAALVSTNSICQGQQVAPLWQTLFDAGIKINFAHRTFVWSNEATDQAHVFCIIVGFSYVDRELKQAWTYSRAGVEYSEPTHLNGYLADAPDVFLTRRSKPISSVPEMAQGFKPADGGNLLLSPSERDELIAREPAAEKWIRKFSMGAEFINGRDRYCLWLPEITGAELKALPLVRKHVDDCREWRLAQTKTGDAFKLADRPHILRPNGKFLDGPYIGIPKVSSERRKWVPFGFVRDGMIPGDMLYFIPSDSLFVFGVMMSQFQNAWMRVVAGRLKSDYRYGNTTVYNNFVFPEVDKAGRVDVEKRAQAVLDARELYAGATLADMYDPDNDFLYPELMKAHRELDKAVERAYGVDFDGDEQKIVSHLFGLYDKLRW